ncbi:hypothetical protein GGR56DRAFT_662094 [Xylariaceae sp. FL0804]|nr:hypothetical protein GGR56DRAFT_662094 [Xylariaceae sp. FL0804]
MGQGETSEPGLVKPPRTFIACLRCKLRKRRCDGATPKCGNCAAASADTECNYAAVRKTRGPGKKHRDADAPGEHRETPQRLVATVPRNDTKPCRELRNHSSVSQDPTHSRERPVGSILGTGPVNDSSPGHPVSHEGPAPAPIGARNRLPILPDFLLPGAFDRNLTELKRTVEAASSTQSFTPLLPIHISRRLVDNCYADIMAEHKLMTQDDFLILVDAQYAAGASNPGEDPARWAVANAVIALALKYKIAPGSEAEMSPIAQSFYQNATSVTHRLILGEPSILSVQALLAMAMFAKGIPDVESFIMLVTNATRLLQLARLRGGLGVDGNVVEQNEHVFEVANAFDRLISHEFF